MLMSDAMVAHSIDIPVTTQLGILLTGSLLQRGNNEDCKLDFQGT